MRERADTHKQAGKRGSHDMRCAKFTAAKPRTRQPRRSSSSSDPSEVVAALRSSPRIQHHTMPQQRASKATPGRSHHPLNSIGPKPVQSEGRTGGGRHLQPPSASNTKLKHKCPFDGCPWRFATPYKLRRHIKSHTKETPYLCQECGRGFSVRYNLLMHIQTIHSQPQKYRCPMRGCKDAFHSQPRLNGHLRRIHKKDWKTLQIKSEEETNSGGSAPNSRSSSTSSSDDGSPNDPSQADTQYQCPQCKKDCGTQAKLNTHLRSHVTAGGKPFKCTVQGCDKSFPSKDRLTKHLDTHKDYKHFCCPHTNCNRIFLRQSHLKTHLKIHTQGQFACPVLDCSQRFSSEGGYNEHLSTHINYGHKCPDPSCDQSFPTLKRLELHCRAVHNTLELGENPFIPGGSHPRHQFSLSTQPHLPSSTTPHRHVDPLRCSFSSSSSFTCKPEFLNYVPGIVESVDLPGLMVEDIEAVFSEKSDWSGREIEQFLRSAVDLSEMEAKLFSNGGNESDSGYSTTPYDVSPITSAAPFQVSCYAAGGSFQNPLSLDPPSLLENLSPTTPSFSLPVSLSHDPGSSTSDMMGFFPGTSSYTSPFLPDAPAVSHAFLPSYPYSAAASSILNGGPACSPNVTSNFSSEFTDFLASSCPFDSTRKPRGSEMPPLTVVSPSSTMTSLVATSRSSSDGQIAASFMSDGSLKPSGSYLWGSRSVPNIGKLIQGDRSMILEEQGQAVSMGTDNLLLPEVSTIKVEANPSCCAFDGGNSATAIAHGGTTRDDSTSTATSKAQDVPPKAGKPAVSEKPSVATSPGQQLPKGAAQPKASSSGNSSCSNLQSLMSMCSQLPVLNKLLASSNNPAVFLVAINTALSTLTRPFQGGEDETTDAAGEGSIVGSITDKDGQYSIEQLQSLVSKLSPAQLEQLMKVKSEPQLGSNAQATAPPIAPPSAKVTERTVFASVLPTSRGATVPPCSLVTITGCGPSTSSSPSIAPSTTQHRYSIHGTAIVSSKPIPTATMTKKTTPGQKARLHRTNNHTAMKSSQKRRQAQWPRSMNQANLIAFREHILNKLKMSPDGQGSENTRAGDDIAKTSRSPSVPMTTSRLCNEVTVKCERHPLTGVRCQSAPAAFCTSIVEPLRSTLQSESNISCEDGDGKIPLLSDLLLQTSSCDDLFDFGFNPDSLLSSSTLSLPSDLLDDMATSPGGMATSPGGYECPGTIEEDEELRQLLGEEGSTAMETSETPTAGGIARISHLLSEAQRTISAESPSPPPISLVERDLSHSEVGAISPRNATVTGSYAEDRVFTVATASSPNRDPRMFRATAMLQRMGKLTPPRYSIPAANSIHGSMTGLNSMGADGASSLQLHIEQNLESIILQTHHDPLLAGNATCSLELFDF